MASYFATLNIDGQLPIPADAQEDLGLHPGTRFELLLENGRIVLQPIIMDELDELRGILAGGPDLVEELQRERRQDDW